MHMHASAERTHASHSEPVDERPPGQARFTYYRGEISRDQWYEAVVASCVRGDHSALFEYYIDTCERGVYTIARSSSAICRNGRYAPSMMEPGDLSSITAEKLLRYVQRNHPPETHGQFQRLVWTIARNAMLDIASAARLRNHDSVDAYHHVADPSSMDLDTIHTRVDIEDALRGVRTERQLEALSLTYWGELSMREAAEVLGTSAPSVKSLVRRARVSMKKALTDSPAVDGA